jgi:hypothetical protein
MNVLIVMGCLFAIVFLVGSAWLILWGWERLTMPPLSPQKLAEMSRRRRERLLHPDWAAFAKHYGRPPPPLLKALYETPEDILRGGFEVQSPRGDEYYIAWYEPADAENWNGPGDLPGQEKYFVFANDGFGNHYTVDPAQDDPPVVFFDHDTGEINEVCGALSEFLRWLREPAGDAPPAGASESGRGGASLD